MSKVVILGAGFSGHTAALFLRKFLPREHEVHVISAQSYFQFMPSLVWVGVNQMEPDATCIELGPVYEKQGIRFTVDPVTAVFPDEQVVKTKQGEVYSYDFLINATGPYLNFEATPGLGPDNGFTSSVCTKGHAAHAGAHYQAALEKMRQGEQQTIVVGTGHAGSTCQGAAFEYIQNIHFDLVDKKLRHRCRLIWFSNEPALGDLGMGAFVFNVKGEIRKSEELTRWLLDDCGIETMLGVIPLKSKLGKFIGKM